MNETIAIRDHTEVSIITTGMATSFRQESGGIFVTVWGAAKSGESLSRAL
jgi:hypothetical protein